MTSENADARERAIRDQFSRQAAGFVGVKEPHADDGAALVIDSRATDPGRQGDRPRLRPWRGGLRDG